MRVGAGFDLKNEARRFAFWQCNVLYLSSNSRASNVSGYKIPVAGGVIGLAALSGVGLVMMRFGFLRYFRGLAILG